MSQNNIPEVDSPIPPQTAVSVYSQDAMDDFPVLKAFQQYINDEQAKARKRMLLLGTFFGILTGAIIAVFVVLLMNMTMRNQQLNDRLLEFAMKDRDRSPVVVQSPAPQSDSSAFLASLAAKLDALHGKISENQAKKAEPAEKAAREAPSAAASAPAKPTAEALEIERLRAQLAAEREKAAVEKERRRQAELEEYRRKHYPELYRKPERRTPDDEIEEILKETDDKAITYFDEGEEEEPEAESRRKPAKRKPAPAAKQQEPAYTIPVDVKKPKSAWRIPAE